MYLQKYFKIVFDKHASQNFKYLYLFLVTWRLEPWKNVILLLTIMYLVHVSQLVKDFHLKDLFSTINTMETNICFIIISFDQVQCFQFSPKIARWKQKVITDET